MRQRRQATEMSGDAFCDYTAVPLGVSFREVPLGVSFFYLFAVYLQALELLIENRPPKWLKLMAIN